MEIPFCVKEPFTPNEYADVILRSCDEFDFYITKVFLVMASPIFKDMFSLPQPAQSTGRIEALNLPVVDIAEHGNVTDVLLRFIYPTDEPELPVELMSGVLIAAQKYEMRCTLKWAKKVIRAMCSGDGSAVLQAFALACNHHLEDEARLAAWNSLQYHLLGEPFSHSLDSVSGRASVNLFEYHNEIGKRILGLFSTMSTLPTSVVEAISCSSCLGTKVNKFLQLPQWWTNICADMVGPNSIRNDTSGPLSTDGFSMEYFMRKVLSAPHCYCQRRVLCENADKMLYNVLRAEMKNVASQVKFELPWKDDQ